MQNQIEMQFQEKTAAGLLQVWQERNQRWLTIDSVEQSRIDIAQEKELVSPLHHAFLAVMLFIESPDKILLAGLGGGALARYLHKIKAEIKGVAVENNKQVAEIAGHYFNLPKNNWSVIIDDIQHHHGSGYDYIVVDIAEGVLTPAWLTEEKMVSCFKQQLSERGVLAINLLVSDAQSFSDNLKTIRKIFNRRTLCLSVPNNKNIVVFAFNQQVKYSLSEQSCSRTDALSKLWGLDYKELLRQIKIDNPVGSGVV